MNLDPENEDPSHAPNSTDEALDWYSGGHKPISTHANEPQPSSPFQTMIQKLHIGSTLAALILFFLP